MSSTNITHLFLDIGGVLLTNGWDRHMRRNAAEKFGLDPDDLNDRHKMSFDTYEEGKLSLDTYLNQVVFYKDRPFSRESFKEFMFAQSQPKVEMINLVSALKWKHRLKTAAISNEGRELTIHRIKKFDLTALIDFFVSSCFVHFRKPDADMYRMALDISQAEPERSVYIDDRSLFVEIAQGMGIKGIHHTDFEVTRRKLRELGLESEQ
ncbi:MAG: HAD family phosphatase [Deltaproteobacteria bacterium]|jgi:putative hydrolase of the HAD superfamily